MDPVSIAMIFIIIMGAIVCAAIRWSPEKRRKRVRIYQVWLKGMSKFVEVKAHDVDLEVDSDLPGSAYWSFTDNSEDAITLHAFPYAEVAYIVSVEA